MVKAASIGEMYQRGRYGMDVSHRRIPALDSVLANRRSSCG